MLKNAFTQKQVNKLPETPGVYIFANEEGTIYIGKAKNLKSRVSSYLGTGLFGKTKTMVREIKTLSFIKTASEFEALLLEAKMVRAQMPKYNFQLKDDKSPLYIGITADKFPRVITLRKTQIESNKLQTIFGPFTNGLAVREVLKRLRRIIPFSTHKVSARACLESQIGLCSPCPSQIAKTKEPKAKLILTRKYLKNIRLIKNILSGKINAVKKGLLKEMNKSAKAGDFETAIEIRDQIAMLQYVTNPELKDGPYLENPNFYEDLRTKEMESLKLFLTKNFLLKIDNFSRFECFDVAHLAGSFPTASMVTFLEGEPEKKLYRHFKIKIVKKGSDVDSLRSVFERRVQHFTDWGRPDLIIIDGGKPQVAVAQDVFAKFKIPIIGLAKARETVFFLKDGKFLEKRPQGPALFILQRIRNEAHRFARRLHHQQVGAILKKG